MDAALIPTAWKQALSFVQQFCPEAIISGGALRDLDNDRPVKDIDIFVSVPAAAHDRLSALYRLNNELLVAGADVREIDPNKLYPVGEGNDVVGCFEMLVDGLDLPVQVIMIDHHKSEAGDHKALVMARIDYGICQIAFDGETVETTAAYRSDKFFQVFELRQDRRDDELAASIHRYARLSQKYPGWKWRPFYQFRALEEAL